MPRRIIIVSICFSFVFITCIKKKENPPQSLPPPSIESSASPAVGEEIKGLISEPKTKVRTSPSDEASVVMELDVGVHVEVIETRADKVWHKVSIADSGKAGWIKQSQLMEYREYIAFSSKQEESKPLAVNTESIVFTQLLILPLINNDQYKNASAVYQEIFDAYSANGRFKIMSTDVAFSLANQFKTQADLMIGSEILKQIGGIEPVDGVINGKITELKSKSKRGNRFELVLHLYHTKEGILYSIDKAVIFENDDDPKKIAKDLVTNMIDRLPYFAVVNNVDGEMITINQGSNVLLHEADALPIFRVTNIIRDSKDNTFTSCGTVKIGNVRITKIYDRSAEGKLEDKTEEVQKGYLVGEPIQ